MLTFMEHFPPAGRPAECFTHFTEEEAEAQRGLSDFLKATRLGAACWYANPSFLRFWSQHSHRLWNDPSVLGLICLQAFPVAMAVSPALPNLAVHTDHLGGGKCRSCLRNSGWEPRNLHFSHMPGWHWGCWSRDHTRCSKGPDSRWPFSLARLDLRWLGNLLPFL